MRIALISDIHGNLISFETVLADIDHQAVDQIIFLGDAVTLGPHPQEVMALLRHLDCPCIMGNHDYFVLHSNQFQADDHAPDAKEKMAWCVAQLSTADFDYLRSFQLRLKIDQGANSSLLCFHGSPGSFHDFILATTPPAELDELLAGYSGNVMVGGHTHVQMIRRHKETLVVNVGSVGEAFEQMPFTQRPKILPWAEYAIITWFQGTIGVELRRVPLKLAAIKNAAANTDMPYLTDWLQKW